MFSHIIVTPTRHNIYEGKFEQINNLCIICFTIYFNGNFKHSNMNMGQNL